MSMKRILLRIIGSKHTPFRLQLKPGTTPSDIRAHLQLDEKYILAYAFDPTDPFTEDDDVFSLVMDGERLIALIPQNTPSTEKLSEKEDR